MGHLRTAAARAIGSMNRPQLMRVEPISPLRSGYLFFRYSTHNFLIAGQANQWPMTNASFVLISTLYVGLVSILRDRPDSPPAYPRKTEAGCQLHPCYNPVAIHLLQFNRGVVAFLYPTLLTLLGIQQVSQDTQTRVYRRPVAIAIPLVQVSPTQ